MAINNCKRCGRELIQAARGRKREYCSHVCREMHFQYRDGRRKLEIEQSDLINAWCSTFNERITVKLIQMMHKHGVNAAIEAGQIARETYYNVNSAVLTK